ncbi:hypothetical protein FB45DRAFT_1039728 [Roridomyces roridus]|uniref:DUF5648 domain-containing protein n=1 Tax=Roridomyces roridus TaxID=1738132 RepID=A0AAD7B3B7_9AGAR|nr:hypothetical protein FB45DRAFT_1039728 [Roridomyces roridus]
MKALSVLFIAIICCVIAKKPAESGPALQTRTCGMPADALPFYRAFNSPDTDHWYTPDVNAMNTFNKEGWLLEGVLGLVFLTQEEGTAPLFHLINLATIDNFYTMNISEVRSRLRRGSGVHFDGKPADGVHLPNASVRQRPGISSL